jgi:hypothetical protein
MKLKFNSTAWILLLLVVTPVLKVIAQQPTKEEIEEMKKAMKEMKADPEMQKAMKQYGIDMNKVENALQGVETHGFGAYYEFEEFMTPQKDDARIAGIPKKNTYQCRTSNAPGKSD